MADQLQTLNRPDLLKLAYRSYWNATTPNEERLAYILILMLGGADGFAAERPDSTHEVLK